MRPPLRAYSSTHEGLWIAPAFWSLRRRRWPRACSAQQNQAIYPAYDGFLKNPDGSYTLAFAYFSHNAERRDHRARPEQQPSRPRPAIAMQPTTFKPGHWRFQCVMVVGPEFDGKMKWTLTYAGITTGTSERMLQSNWNLVEGAPALSKIDYAKVPKGVCLNRAPTVRVLGVTVRPNAPPPTLNVALNEELNLFGSVQDEGLPRGKGLVDRVEAAEGTGHGELHDSRRGAHEGHVLRARRLRARAHGERFRVHRTNAGERHASSNAPSGDPV